MKFLFSLNIKLKNILRTVPWPLFFLLKKQVNRTNPITRNIVKKIQSKRVLSLLQNTVHPYSILCIKKIKSLIITQLISYYLIFILKNSY